MTGDFDFEMSILKIFFFVNTYLNMGIINNNPFFKK